MSPLPQPRARLLSGAPRSTSGGTGDKGQAGSNGRQQGGRKAAGSEHPQPHTGAHLPEEQVWTEKGPGSSRRKRLETDTATWRKAKQDPRLGLHCGETAHRALFQASRQNVTVERGSEHSIGFP